MIDEIYDISQLRFLVVDDNRYMRELICNMLIELGSKSENIEQASDGADGLDCVERFSPDIIITDWVMPIFDGMEFAKMLRKSRSKGYDTPIIMVSGHTKISDVKNARDAGVTEFLAKPVSAKFLYARIVSVITKQREFIDEVNFSGPDRRRTRNADWEGKNKRKR